MQKKHYVARTVYDALIFLFVIYAWFTMMRNSYGGMFSAAGLYSLKYFTVDSNLFAGLVSLVCLVLEIRALREGKKELPRWLSCLRLAATVGVTITFAVVLAFLGPVFGYGGLFRGANFFFHFLVPVLCILFFVFTRRKRVLPLKATLLGMVPMLLYGVYYVGNLLINGLTDSLGYTNDWYGFLAGDLSRIPLALFIMILVDALLSLLLVVLGSKRPGKETAKETAI
ncbi:MAG: hypothetical protein IJ708_11515 [Clostridia bacterium]|nr:hypothetical protein [Clostridia bacterium]